MFFLTVAVVRNLGLNLCTYSFFKYEICLTVTLEEVEKMIKSLKTSGPEGIVPQLIKYGAVKLR